MDATVGRTEATTADADGRRRDAQSRVRRRGIGPPYLLVGYSSGGWNVMVHADAHPADVVGAVMVDVRPPAASQDWLKVLPPASATESEAIKIAREESTTFDTDPTLNPEGLRLGDSAAQALKTKGFGDKPLIVLAAADTSVVSEGFEPALGATLVKIWWDLQDELASRSPQGRLIKVRKPSAMRSRRSSATERSAHQPEPVRMGVRAGFRPVHWGQPGGAAGSNEEVD